MSEHVSCRHGSPCRVSTYYMWQEGSLVLVRNVLTSILQTAGTGLEYPTQKTLLGMARGQSSIPLEAFLHEFDIAGIHTFCRP